MSDFNTDISVGSLTRTSQIFKTEVLSTLLDQRINSLISVDSAGNVSKETEMAISVAFVEDIPTEKLSGDNIVYFNSSDQFDVMGGRIVSCADGVVSGDCVNKKQLGNEIFCMTTAVESSDFGACKKMIDVGTNSEISVTLRYDSTTGTPKFVFITQ